MRLAVEFKRYGAARYCSHLDMQRAAMRAVRRTDLMPEYTAGFNPHMVMSFASAMPVGLVSDSEYFELRLKEDAEPEHCLSQLKRAMPEGIEPVFAGRLKEDAPKLMAALKFADYEAEIAPEAKEAVKKVIANLLQSDMIEIEMVKDGKRIKKDIRPLIKELSLSEDGARVHMLLAASSEGSLNPEILMKHLTNAAGAEPDYSVRRKGLFTITGGRTVPLRDLCK
jgi:radical SAM-linked protein